MNCPKCKAENTRALNFCSSCGTRLLELKPAAHKKPVAKTMVLFFVLLGYIAILNLVPFENDYVTGLITDSIFALIVLVFFLLDVKNYTGFLKQRITNYGLLFLMPVALIGFAFAVYYLSDFINSLSDKNLTVRYLDSYLDAPYPLLYAIISIGVFPAIFEELAFRGILYNELVKLTSVNATIIVTAILFTVLHFSFISFLWILPLGLLFGYIRSRYNSIVYGMLGHFVYNSGIVLIEYYSLY
jgi:membrane protease YdiL (CAAX protease family)